VDYIRVEPMSSDHTSRLASRYRLIIAFGSKRSCHHLVLYHAFTVHEHGTFTQLQRAHAGHTQNDGEEFETAAPTSVFTITLLNLNPVDLRF
jgi:hypothetical protein